MDEDATTIKPPAFKTWPIPTRDPIHVHDHWPSFCRQILRAPYYRNLLDWLSEHHDSHHMTTFNEWTDENFLRSASLPSIFLDARRGIALRG